MKVRISNHRVILSSPPVVDLTIHWDYQGRLAEEHVSIALVGQIPVTEETLRALLTDHFARMATVRVDMGVIPALVGTQIELNNAEKEVISYDLSNDSTSSN